MVVAHAEPAKASASRSRAVLIGPQRLDLSVIVVLYVCTIAGAMEPRPCAPNAPSVRLAGGASSSRAALATKPGMIIPTFMYVCHPAQDTQRGMSQGKQEAGACWSWGSVIEWSVYRIEYKATLQGGMSPVIGNWLRSAPHKQMFYVHDAALSCHAALPKTDRPGASFENSCQYLGRSGPLAPGARSWGEALLRLHGCSLAHMRANGRVWIVQMTRDE